MFLFSGWHAPKRVALLYQRVSCCISLGKVLRLRIRVRRNQISWREAKRWGDLPHAI